MTWSPALPEPGAAGHPRTVWGVAALLAAAGESLQSRFGALTVRGEISGFARASSGHCYFSLKDADGAAALLRCAMFRRAASLLDFAPADGQQVELRGRIGVYDARGELQVVVESLRPLGAGSLYEEFLRLRAKLEAQGLFDPARKRLPVRWPAALGIVTSTGAAALHDVLSTLARRAPQVRVVVYPSPVQGAEAPAALVAALAVANARAEVDTLLLVRGGGALEDLWAFNDERVVRAVAASRIPTICGVGHETDITLADLAADLRAPTPTAAAELAAPAQAEALARLALLALALRRATQRALDNQAQRLDTQALRLARPARSLAGLAQTLASLEQRLRAGLSHRGQALAREPALLAARLLRAMPVQLDRQSRRLQSHAERLAALDPRRVLARGYAWVEGDDGRPVVSVQALTPGQTVTAVWADGRAQAEVRQIEPGPPSR